MKWMCKQHEEEAVLFAYAEGSLNNVEMERVSVHLQKCPRCEEAVREYQALETILTVPVPPTFPERLREAYTRAFESEADTHLISSRSGMEDFMQTQNKATPKEFPKLRTAPRMKRLIFPLAFAAAMGVAAGLWITRPTGETPAAKDTAYSYYQQAVNAYKTGKKEQAVELVNRGLKGRLVLPQKLEESQKKFDHFATFRELARQNITYSLELARKREKQNAAAVNDLNPKMADQLLGDGTLIAGLVAMALYSLADRNQVELYRAVGDADAAKKAEEEYQTRSSAYRKSLQPKIKEFTRTARTRFTGATGAKQAADEERKLVEEIRKIWSHR